MVRARGGGSGAGAGAAGAGAGAGGADVYRDRGLFFERWGWGLEEESGREGWSVPSLKLPRTQTICLLFQALARCFDGMSIMY